MDGGEPGGSDRRPAILARWVVDRIEEAAIELDGGLAAWIPDELRAALQDEVADLDLVFDLAERLANDDRSAEFALRDALKEVSEFALPDSLEGDLEQDAEAGSSAAAPDEFLAGDAFATLSIAIGLIARDDGDWRELSMATAGLFERCEWVQALYSSARERTKGDGPRAFDHLLRLYAQEWDRDQAPSEEDDVEDAPLAEGQAMKSARGRHPGAGGGRPPRHPSGKRRRRPPRRPRRPRPPRRPPRDPRSRRRRACLRNLLRVAQQLRRWADTHRPTAAVVWAHNIESLNPARACAGQELIIRGSGFGNGRPPGVFLVFPSEGGCRRMEVPDAQWQDTAIRVTVPDWARAGCVGFVDDGARDSHQRYLNGLQSQRERLHAAAAACGARRRPPRGVVIPQTPCPSCTGANRFGGTIPEIASFRANGDVQAIVEPDAALELAWHVRNADSIRVDKVAGPGPDPAVNRAAAELDTDSVTVSLALMQDSESRYVLTASNGCGTVSAEVAVAVRRSTTVTIQAIEVTQAIQTLNVGDPASSNTVFLVAGKRTLVRVYLDSGLPTDYNAGGQLTSVSGRLATTPLSGQSGTFDPPLNLDAFAGARPGASVNRMTLGHTLNFEIPASRLAAGALRLTVFLSSTDPLSRWTSNSQAIDVTLEASTRIQLVLLRVNDQFRAMATTTDVELMDGVREIRAIYPVAGSRVELFAPVGSDTITTDMDFDNASSWRQYGNPFSSDLLDLVEEIAEEHEDNGEVWCAVLPQAACTANRAINGTAISGGFSWYAKATWLALSPQTAPHEVGHTQGFGHETSQTGIVGCDVAARQLFPNTAPVLMQGGMTGRWISLDMYAGLLAELKALEGG